MLKGTYKFCLMHTNYTLTYYKPSSKLVPEDIPLIQFVDMDQDGMLDMMFYHKGAVYIHYNLHKSKAFNFYSIKDGGESLCFKSNETSIESIFANISEMTAKEFIKGGNVNISI